ncbi:succinate dehydrogenase [Halovenus salina]|uniref:Succinate dehydrogenase n=1 Tax=Halovenus salina TaxID=1510225 RepID=A0ABD5VVY6_9EURY|nr:succinate dehydrogenase [Halovenus salina]
MAEHYSSFQRGTWRWLFQRLTAVFLIGALGFHFVLLHFVNHAAEISFMGTQARMGQIGYLSLMITFLVTGAFHGINGVYNALINQGLKGTQRRVVAGVLTIAGVLLVAQGTYVALHMNGFL